MNMVILNDLNKDTNTWGTVEILFFFPNLRRPMASDQQSSANQNSGFKDLGMINIIQKRNG